MGFCISAHKEFHLRILDNNIKMNKERRRLSLSQCKPVNDTKDDLPRGKLLFKKSSGKSLLKFTNKSPENDANTPSSTVDMSVMSASYSKRRLSVSGALSKKIQETFECKAEDVDGDELNNIDLQRGIGYVCRKGLKAESPNQDDFFIYRVDNWGLYGVFDGHGPYGHDVSNFVQKEIPNLIFKEKNWRINPDDVLFNSFLKVHQKLQDYVLKTGKFDCSLSGTTATVVLHQQSEQRIITAHVGDSRCVLARWSKSGKKLEAIDLTNDHKPNSDSEKRRIIAAGGQVKRMEDDIPYRVFVKGKLYPGLAMSRAIGDTIGYQAGIIPEPDINIHHIVPEKDAFLLLCSDGVWEFITSQEAVEIVAEGGFNGAQVSAEKLAREAWKRWIQEEGNVVDDIAVQVIYLNDSMKSPY